MDDFAITPNMIYGTKHLAPLVYNIWEPQKDGSFKLLAKTEYPQSYMTQPGKKSFLDFVFGTEPVDQTRDVVMECEFSRLGFDETLAAFDKWLSTRPGVPMGHEHG